MRVAIAVVFGWVIGLSAGCSPSDTPSPSATPSQTDAPVPEATEVQPNAEAKPSPDSVSQPSAEREIEEPTTTSPMMDQNTGVAIGQKVPSFELRDQDGEVRTLSDLLAEGNVALVFYRSADW